MRMNCRTRHYAQRVYYALLRFLLRCEIFANSLPSPCTNECEPNLLWGFWLLRSPLFLLDLPKVSRSFPLKSYLLQSLVLWVVFAPPCSSQRLHIFFENSLFLPQVSLFFRGYKVCTWFEAFLFTILNRSQGFTLAFEQLGTFRDMANSLKLCT